MCGLCVVACSRTHAPCLVHIEVSSYRYFCVIPFPSCFHFIVCTQVKMRVYEAMASSIFHSKQWQNFSVWRFVFVVSLWLSRFEAYKALVWRLHLFNCYCSSNRRLWLQIPSMLRVSFFGLSLLIRWLSFQTCLKIFRFFTCSNRLKTLTGFCCIQQSVSLTQNMAVEFWRELNSVRFLFHSVWVWVWVEAILCWGEVFSVRSSLRS